MKYTPLRGRVIVTRDVQVTSKRIIIPDTYRDARGIRLADRGRVLAAGEPPEKATDRVKAGDEVFFAGPADKLAIEWEGQKAYAVSYDEVLGVIE